jgi:hypothetical protein
MATVAQAGILGFGPQQGKGYDVPDGEWYRHKATVGDLAIQDDQRLGPPEVGGRPLPTIPFKAGVMVGGGLTIHPRLESSVGYLLKGALGYADTTSGSGGVFNHVFKLDPSNPGFVPWMGFRKYIPPSGEPGDPSLGETYKDCKVLGFAWTLANEGLIAARVDALGREFVLEEDPSWGTTSGSGNGWAADGEFEDYPSIPIGSTPGGYINTPTYGNLPVVNAVITIANQNLDIRQEKVYGSPYLEDITVISRQVGLDKPISVSGDLDWRCRRNNLVIQAVHNQHGLPNDLPRQHAWGITALRTDYHSHGGYVIITGWSCSRRKRRCTYAILWCGTRHYG